MNALRMAQIAECLRLALDRLAALEAPTMPARKRTVERLISEALELLNS